MNKLKKTTKIGIGIGVIVLLPIFLLIDFIAIEIIADVNGIVLPWNRQSAINATKKWGGLSDFPANAKIIEISTSGSAFTRTFDIKFTSDTESIRNWIKISKRLNDNIPTQNNSIDIYDINPGEEGAIGGNVKINWNTLEVTIHISWS